MRLVFAGTPHAAVPTLEALIGSRHEVLAVLTRPAAAAGRGRRVRASATSLVALEHGIEVLEPGTARDPALAARLTELAPDACPVVAYGGLVPAALLDLPAHGWINLHFSLLPAWRGAAPVQHAILAGDEVTGATTFRLEEGLDTGPVLGRLTEPIGADDTSGDLLGRLATAGAGLMVATLDALERGDLVAVPQPADGVSHAPKLTPADARVDWTRPAYAVSRQVRACTPAPGAWTEFREARLKVTELAAASAEDGAALQPGEVAVAGRVLVGTANGAVELRGVQPEGKRAMAAADWARGARIAPGERLR